MLIAPGRTGAGYAVLAISRFLLVPKQRSPSVVELRAIGSLALAGRARRSRTDARIVPDITDRGEIAGYGRGGRGSQSIARSRILATSLIISTACRTAKVAPRTWRVDPM